MFHISNAYFQAKQRGSLPVIVCRIETQRTSYLFSRVFLNDDETGSIQGVSLWDGSVNTGDGGTFGGLPVSYSENGFLQFGSLAKSLVTNAKDLPSSLSQAQIGAYSITFDNLNGFFSRLLGDNQYEPLLGQRLKLYQGFKGLAYTNFLRIFDGEITHVRLSPSTCRVTAEDVATIFPSVIGEESGLIYALRGGANVEMAEEQFTVAELTDDFLTSDSWLFVCNFITDDILNEDLNLFSLISTAGNATILSIGIKNRYPFVWDGYLVESFPLVIEHNSTTSLTPDDFLHPLNLRIFCDSVNDEIIFTIAGVTTVLPIGSYYEKTLTQDIIIQLGKNFPGDIQNWIWNSTHYWVNNLSDDTLTDAPDIVGGFDLPLTSGTWVEWPSI